MRVKKNHAYYSDEELHRLSPAFPPVEISRWIRFRGCAQMVIRASDGAKLCRRVLRPYLPKRRLEAGVRMMQEEILRLVRGQGRVECSDCALVHPRALRGLLFTAAERTLNALQSRE